MLVAATLTAAASGFSNWSHDVGGYLGRAAGRALPARSCSCAGLQFGCFTPLMQAHGRFPQEAWTYDEQTLELYREYVLLHERLVPYVRAAAATAARCGLPIMRPLCLVDPADRRGLGGSPTQYAYGPCAVGRAGARGGRARSAAWSCRAATGSTSGRRSASRGGRELMAAAPLGRIPVWVRSGSILVTHPAEHVAAGLGDHPEAERPLEATLWGEPKLGAAGVRLADGTRIRWRRGEWSVDREREITFAER